MLHLTLRQLRVFEAVAKHLSFSRAGEELHLTQPAVSMQIKQLEENLGLPLFEQLGKRVHLTEAGRELRHYSRSIGQQLTELEAIIEELKGIERGRLKVAVVSTANYFAPQLLARFSERYPAVTVSLYVGNREGVLAQLQENEADLAIMGQPPEGFSAQPFSENPLVVIAPPDHPLARKRAIAVSRLAEETFLVREQGSGTRAAMERFFQSQRIELKQGMEMGTNEAIKQAVQAGMGLGVLSLHTAELELEAKRLTLLDVEKFPILRHWYIVHQSSKRLSKVTGAFKEFLVKEAAELMPGSSPRVSGKRSSDR
jgi:LysR family transcriptional regulator, low CO2-responsive transcriptional regulator